MAKVRITLVRSTIGRPPEQRATVRALGLSKMHQTVVKEHTPQIQGMVKQVGHLLKVEQEA